MSDTNPPSAPTLDTYTIWRTAAHRDYTKLAELCGLPEAMLRQTGRDQGWLERARDDDAQDVAGVTDAAIVELSRMIPSALACLDNAYRVRSRVGTITDGFVPPYVIRASWDLLKLFGVTPGRVALFVSRLQSEGAVVSDAYLASLLASGDTATLLAIAQGRDPSTTIDHASQGAPGDFLSTHAEGRAGLSPPSSLSQRSDPSRRELTPEEWDEQQRTRDIIEAEYHAAARGDKRER